MSTNQTKPDAHPSDAHPSLPDGLTDLIPGVVYLHDLAEGRLVYVSEGVQHTLGYAPDDLLAMRTPSLEALIHPDDRAQVAAHIARVGETGETGETGDDDVLTCEYRMRHKSGAWRWFLSRDRVRARDAGGVPRQMLGVAQDITERKRAEENLRSSEERFRTTMEQSPLSMQIFDAEGRTLAANPAWEHMWNASREELTDYNILKDEQLKAAGLLPSIRNAFDGEVVRLPATYYDPAEIGKPGRGRWIEGYIYPLISEDGETFEVALVHHDITERKQAEEALRESEERQRIAVDAADLGVFEWNVVEDYAIWENDRIYEILGHAREDGPLNKRQVFESYLHPDDVPGFEQALREGMKPGASFHAVCRIRRKADGEMRWVELVGNFALASDGTPRKLVGVIADITERKHAEEAIRDLNETLEERVAERTAQVRQLASKLTMAEQQERRRISQILHDDLQQLLYGIQLKMSFVRRDAEQGKRERLLEHVGEAEAWMDDALDTTRTLTVDLSPPVLKGEGLADTLDWLVSQMREKHRLEVGVTAEHAFHLPDQDMRVLLFQIVRELLFNVVKHAETDRATVTLAEEDGFLMIGVEDEGRGFDLEAAASENGRGGGFGLFSVRERIGLFGGRMEIASAPNDGTRVTVYAPVAPEDERPAGR